MIGDFIVLSLQDLLYATKFRVIVSFHLVLIVGLIECLCFSLRGLELC